MDGKKKKILTKIMVLTTAALTLGACNNDDAGVDSTERTPLNIVAGISMPTKGITRAMETAWEEGDQIGVYVTDHNTTTIHVEGTNTGKNLQYTFNDGTNYETNGNTYRLFTPNSSKLYLPTTYVDVYGYYPYSAGEVEPTAIPVNVSTQTSQAAIDLMRAKKANVNNNNASVELLFEHRLTKLVFNLKQGDDMLTNELNDAVFIGLTLGNQPVAATYNIYTDNFNITPGSETITPVKAASAPLGYVRSFEAIVLPNGTNNPANSRTVTITFYQRAEDTIVNTFTIGSGTSFKPGYKYTFNVTVNATTVEVDTENTYTEQW